MDPLSRNVQSKRIVVRSVTCFIVVVHFFVHIPSINKNKAGGINKHVNKSKGKDLRETCSLFSTSPDAFWKKRRSDILKASYWPQKHATDPIFTTWVDALFSNHFSASEIGKSVQQRPDQRQTESILQVISKRLAYLESLDREAHQPPLHILVTGGSVTQGINCETNPIGLPAGHWTRVASDCPWPVRLQNLFNQALFDGNEVVKVTNLGVGGSSSEIGRVALEYRLFPEEVKDEMPHIVIWSHAANDAQEPDFNSLYYNSLPGYISAARNLRPCDEGLPMVVMFEDSYGFSNYNTVNEMKGMIHKVVSWYGLASTSHSDVVQHKVWSNYGNSGVIESIMGTDFNLHYGLGYHISAAWVVFYLFNSVFFGSCEVLLSDQDKNAGLEFTPSKKYIPSYQNNGNHEMLLDEWKKKMEDTNAFCSSKQSTNDVCTYAWMVNQMTSVRSSSDVANMLKSVLISSSGWKAAGNPIKQPRAGWYAEEENATFTLQIPVSMDTKFLTIMSMKSYGPNFVNTKLEVNVKIVRITGQDSTAQFTIDGYHEIKTSIHVPKKIELPDDGAVSGDTVIITATLVSGAYFKINGFALCIS